MVLWGRMATVAMPFITPEKYVEMDDHGDGPLEYVDGEVFEIEAATLNHGRIQANLGGVLWSLLKKTPCAALGQSTRVRVPSGRYFHPDLSVACGPLDIHKDQSLLNPTVIFEVRSKSTSGFDMGDKSILYRTIPALKEYILIDQSRPWVQQWMRHGSRWLVDETAGLESVLRIEALGCEVPFSELYADVEFEATEE